MTDESSTGRRRRAWNGRRPGSPAEARQRLIDATQRCVERLGSSVSLSHVAEEAGVTRQTVYRYFDDMADLANAAMVYATGGFHERLRRHAMRAGSGPERLVETLVYAISRIGSDPYLGTLLDGGLTISIEAALRLELVQLEMLYLCEGDDGLSKTDRDELSELLLRLLHSYVADTGVHRSEEDLRTFMYRWILPMIEHRMAAGTAASDGE